MFKAGGGLACPETRHPLSQAGAFPKNVIEIPLGMNASYPIADPLYLLFRYYQQVLPVATVTSQQAGPAKSTFASWM